MLLLDIVIMITLSHDVISKKDDNNDVIFTEEDNNGVLIINHTSATPFGGDKCGNLSDNEKREFSYILAIFFGLPASAIIFVTVFGNFLVLCFKAKVGKHQTTLLIWNLGLADFMVGIFVLPLGVLNVVSGKWFFGRLMCKIWTSCDVVFCTASIVTLCIISVDRYIGVTRPLRYKLIVTKNKVKMANFGIWFFSITILLATVKYSDDGNECYNPDVCAVSYELAHVVHSVVFAFFLPAMVTLVLYWKIYSVAKKREKGLMQGLMMAMSDNFLRDCFSVPLRMHCGKDNHMSQQQQIIKMHKKVAKTLGVVVSAFLLCWLPFFSLYLVSFNCGDCIPHLVLDITTWFGYCNSCINPLIYAFTLSEFRKSVRKIFQTLRQCRICRCRSCDSERDMCLKDAAGLTARSSQGLIVPRSDRAYSLPVQCADNDVMDRKKKHRQSTAVVGKLSPNRATTAKTANRNMQWPDANTPTTTTLISPSPSHLANGSNNENRRQSGGLASNYSPSASGGKNLQGLSAASGYTPGACVTELVWSAKLYAMLISPQSTKL